MALTKVTSGGISDIAAAVEGASDSNKFTDADHSKLNAIEASATADQTKSDIEGLGIDVPAANLTGTIPDARFPATLPAISGANLTGISSVGGVTGVDFNDNVKARFGAGNDLEIYHDGTSSWIKETNASGDFHIQGKEVVIKASNGENTAIFREDGAVELNHNNVKKLETTLKGAQVTGTMAVGSTPLDLYSGYSGFQVGSNGFIFGQHSAGADKNLWLSQNSWADGSGNERAISTGKVSSIMQSSGNINFKVAASVNANANITWKTPFKVCHQSVTGGDWCTVLNQSMESNGTVYYMNFTLDGSGKGAIRGDSNSVSYNTSSDYRLKENVDYTWDATTRLKQLKPCRFNWISDDTNTTLDGFLAHEVTGIVPEAAHGIKDETETYTDDDGNEQTRPVYQGIDQSKLVPLLVKAMQEQQTTIESLTARITALEG